MVLVDHQIRAGIENEAFEITPYNPDQVNPNSYDLRLGDEFKYYSGYMATPIDPYIERDVKLGLTSRTGRYIIKKHEYILGSTLESISLPDNLCAELNGKSSLARLGVQIHQTGGWIDCGFSGTITLEIFNSGPRPVVLYPGMLIGQLVFHPTEPAEEPYNRRGSSKYNGQQGPVESRYYQNRK